MTEQFLRPRHPQGARGTAALLFTVGAAVQVVIIAAQLLVSGTVIPAEGHAVLPDLIVTSASIAVLLVLAWCCRLDRPWVNAALGLPFPLVGVLIVVVMNLYTHDAGVGAMAVAALPALYGGYHLRTGGAAVVLLATLLGEGVVLLHLEDTLRAVQDLFTLVVSQTAVTGFLLQARNAQYRLADAMSEQAQIDPLTGLATRARLTAGIAAADARGAALLIVDMDGMRAINDAHGQTAGDAALACLAELLQGAVRPSDMVARMSGDQLAVLLLGCPLEMARARAEVIRDCVREHPVVLADGRTLAITVSVGVAATGERGFNAEELVRAADYAVLIAKREGRDRVQVAGETTRAPRLPVSLN